MNVLAVDTSTLRLGVGVVTREGRNFSRRWPGGDHSSPLFARIVAALREVGLDANDVELLAVVSGPGSFTGLRIGMAGLLGWAVAGTLPIQTVDSFTAMRSSVPDDMYPLLIVIHSRGTDFYMQYLESKEAAKNSAPFIGSISSLLDLPAVSYNVCGPGAEKLLRLRRDDGRLAAEMTSTDYLEPDMATVCTTAMKLFSEREANAGDYRIEPYYMTLSQAQINFEGRERRL